MRRIVLLLGPLVATLALFACEDSGAGGSSGIFTLDSAPFEGSPPSEAGPPGDSAVDAPAAPDSVTVNVVRGAAPAAGVMVVFHDAAGAVVETKSTGADGKATSSVGAKPAQASILLGSGSRRHIITWTAVEPGDELLARDDSNTNGGTYDVTLQGSFADGGATSLNASIGSCMGFGNNSPLTVYMTPECQRPTTAIVARALGVGGDLLAYAYVKGGKPGPSDGGAGAASVGPWLAPSSVTVTPKNLPALVNDSAALFEIADSLGVDNPTGAMNRVNGTTTFKVAPGFAEAYQAAVRVTPNDTPGATILVAKRGAPAANTDIDFAGAPPTIDSAKLLRTTPARPQVDWTTLGAAPLTSTDGGAVFLNWYDSREDSGSWTLIVPPTAKSVKAPAMPASAEPWLPHGANDAGPAAELGEPMVIFAEADLLANYAAFRRQVGLVIPLTASYQVDSRAVLPATGTLKLTSFQELGPR